MIAIAPLAACAGGASSRTAGTSVPVESAVPPPISATPNVASLPAPKVPTKPPEDASRLVGLSGETVLAWMGETVFVRRDGIAEIWRFAADTCYLDVFLYRENDGLKVAHIDARARSGAQRITAQACYGRILASRPAPGSS